VEVLGTGTLRADGKASLTALSMLAGRRRDRGSQPRWPLSPRARARL
jgi:hypothetical protein